MTDAPPTTLGEYIRAKRTAAGMNQTALAELISTAQHVVSAYETDKRVPGARTLALLAQHLPGADATELLRLIPSPPPGPSAAAGRGDGRVPDPPDGDPATTP